MVGGAGFIHLHKAIVFVSRVVGSQDVHLIPALRFPKVWGGHSKGGSSSGDPHLTEGSPSSFQACTELFRYSLVEARIGARCPVVITVRCGQDFCDPCRLPQVLEPQISNPIALTYCPLSPFQDSSPFFLASALGVLNSSLLSQVCRLLANR